MEKNIIAEKAAVKEAEAEKTAAKETEAEKAAVKETEAEKAAVKETEAEKATVKEAEAEKTAAKEAEAKKTVAKGKETEKEAEKVTGMGSRAEETCCCHQKAVPRQEKEVKQLKNRLNRIMGQLNGIGRMLEENRYCGDILTQVAAVESALQSFGYLILQEHMKSCVVDEIRNGNTSIVEEAVELMKKLK